MCCCANIGSRAYQSFITEEMQIPNKRASNSQFPDVDVYGKSVGAHMVLKGTVGKQLGTCQIAKMPEMTPSKSRMLSGGALFQQATLGLVP